MSQKHNNWTITFIIISLVGIYLSQLYLNPPFIRIIAGIFFFSLGLFAINYILALEKNFSKNTAFSIIAIATIVIQQYFYFKFTAILALIFILIEFIKENNNNENRELNPFKDSAFSILNKKDYIFKTTLLIIYSLTAILTK